MSKGLRKRSIYVLLPIVLVIWGLIIYRVLNLTATVEHSSLKASPKDDLLRQEQNPREELSLNYPDPFGLGKPKARKSDKKRNSNRTTRRDWRVPQWPDLKYNGIVTAKKTNKRISIISIEDRQYFFLPDQQHQQIKLLQAWNDSARVTYQDSLIKMIYK